MPLITALSRDFASDPAAWGAVQREFVMARAASWTRLEHLVRERPVTGVVLDSAALPPRLEQEGAVIELMRSYPSLATVLIARPGLDRQTLFRLGRAGLSSLVLLPLEALPQNLVRTIRRAFTSTADAIVARAVSPYLPAGETRIVRLAMEGVQLGWGADDLATMTGWTRAHLSVRLRARGLPSAGHLLTWAKLLHAGRWLSDPGRSAESVSRQLEYSSGAAFRRALRAYVGLTPTQVRDGGGITAVLDRFRDECDLESRRADRSVA